MSYRELAEQLGRLQANRGGSDEQRRATAHLIVALFHARFVELARALRREDVEAAVGEDVSSAWLRVGGVLMQVWRFAHQTCITLELSGFDLRVVEWNQVRRDYEIGAWPDEVAAKMVDEAVATLGVLLRHSMALLPAPFGR